MKTDKDLVSHNLEQNRALLSSADLHPAPPGSAWYCLHTRSRREKCVAKDCASRSIPYFLPLRKSIRRIKGRNYIFDVPLFSGYLFCAATPDQRYGLLKTNNLAKVIEVPDPAGLLQDLRQIAFALECQAPIEPFPYLKRGVMVRIQKGPFEGIVGVVSRREKKFRVVLNVRLLQQAVALEIDGEMVKPV
jgi:transcription antitermination factor NusG